MTSAPVKGVNSLMNYVGTKANVQSLKTSNDGFGSAMSRATGENRRSDADKQTTLSKCTNGSNVSETSKNIRNVKPDDRVKASKSQESETEPSAKMEEMGKELVDRVAEALDITEEEVLDAMEVLGMNYLSLLEPGSLQELVLEVCGETDVSALLTNEGLFNSLQTLNRLADDMRQALIQETGLTSEELEQLFVQTQDMQTDGDVTEADLQKLLGQDTEEVQQDPEIAIEVKVDGEEAAVKTDEAGNIEKTLETATEEAVKQSGEKHHGHEENHGQQEHRSETPLHSENVLLNTVLQEKVTVQESSFLQHASAFAENTQEIMDQILNYMKIQLKPGMSQLEMQLHPESLGTVHVQITSKGGEITAEFHVQNENVKAALEGQIMELKDNFREQGIKVEAVEVSVDAKGFESNLWQGQERREAYESNKKPLRRMNLNQLDSWFEEEATEEELLNAEVMEMNGSTVDYTA